MSDSDAEHTELIHKLHQADWNIGKRAIVSSGVTLTFRKHYTSNFPGMETRQAHGEDDKEAIRKFLAELAEEDAG